MSTSIIIREKFLSGTAPEDKSKDFWFESKWGQNLKRFLKKH